MITDISTQRGKSSIYFDGIRGITARTTDVRACKIKVGTEIEPEEVLEKLAQIQFPSCYEAALSILDVCSQTRASIIQKLKLKGYVNCVCEQVADKLLKNGLIDENRYSERLVEYQSTRPVSRLNVRRKLMAKGIDPETIEESLSVMDEKQQLDACKKAIVPLLRKYRNLEPHEARQKILQSLARKGFSWDICSSVIESFTGSDE